MERKKNLYRGEKQLDYERPFNDKEKSTEKIKEYMREKKRLLKRVEKNQQKHL